MHWCWQRAEWPNFTWEPKSLQTAEARFLEGAGVVVGAAQHLDASDRQALQIELMGLEAVSTSAIEGEILDRDSVQSSIRKQLGLDFTGMRINPAEAGIAEMAVNLYQTVDEPLTDSMMFEWHRMLLNGRRDIGDMGRYRTHPDPMQIVSGPDHRRTVHYEAPPSAQVPKEMRAFVLWFNETRSGPNALPALTRAGLAHLWFECIHPFEDGNGRIGRAIAEKALAQGTSVPTMTALAHMLLRHRKQYYAALEASSQRLEVSEWLAWFSQAALEAQNYAHSYVRLLIEKARLFDRLKGRLNSRQEKALLRMFKEGPDGFKGGLSAKNYATITGTYGATTTRDLVDLVKKGALFRTGERKSTRYFLNVSLLTR